MIVGIDFEGRGPPQSPPGHVYVDQIKTAEIFDGEIHVCEPNINSLPTSLKSFKNIKLSSVDNCLEGADIIVLLTDHREFAEISSHLLKDKSIIDTRGVWKNLLTKAKNDG